MSTTSMLFFAFTLLALALLFGCFAAINPPTETPKGVYTVSGGGISTAYTVNYEESTYSLKGNAADAEINTTYSISWADTVFDANLAYEITLKEVKFLQPKNSSSQHLIPVAYFEIKNTGAKKGILWPRIYLADENAKRYDYGINLGIDPKYSQDSELYNYSRFLLMPNGTISGWLAFYVPNDAALDLIVEYTNPSVPPKPYYIEYKPAYIKYTIKKTGA